MNDLIWGHGATKALSCTKLKAKAVKLLFRFSICILQYFNFSKVQYFGKVYPASVI